MIPTTGELGEIRSLPMPSRGDSPLARGMAVTWLLLYSSGTES